MPVVVANPLNRDIVGRKRPTAIMNHVFFGKTLSFSFPASPLEISFDNLSAKYQEVPRAGKYPIIIFEELSLTQASINFRLFNKRSGGAVSVEKDMKKLRSMATAPGYVWFQGVDKMLQEPLQPVLLNGNKSRNTAWWRITDFSMDVVYRNSRNEATQVDCQIQLTEERNPTIPTLVLPKIVYPPTPAAPPRSSRNRRRTRRGRAATTTRTPTRSSSGSSVGGNRTPPSAGCNWINGITGKCD